MLSYQHGYHAGNFADVIKHLTLTRIINHLSVKDKPVLYLETHAGQGMYDLKSSQSAKTHEFAQGISSLWEARAQAPACFSAYFAAIKSLNNTHVLRYYPGSPYLALYLLRLQDRFVFTERHAREFEYLEQLPTLGKHTYFNQGNGLDELKARLPPLERRGLIFIDPSYEIKEDYRQIPQTIHDAYQRFATGVYCLWYPIVDKKLHEQLIRRLQAIGADKHLRLEFFLTPTKSIGLTGCGLWIINPPHTLQAQMKTSLDFLSTIFNPGVSSYISES